MDSFRHWLAISTKVHAEKAERDGQYRYDNYLDNTHAASVNIPLNGNKPNVLWELENYDKSKKLKKEI